MKTLFIPQSIDSDGFKVPISCTFTGVKFLPIIALATNSAFPNLTLYQEHFTYRVIRKSSAKYSDIEKVDAVAFRLIQNLTLYFKNSLFILTVQILQPEDLNELSGFFYNKGCLLTEKATILLNSR